MTDLLKNLTIRLHASDNVVVAREPVGIGQAVPAEGFNCRSQVADEHALARGMVAQVSEPGLEVKMLGIPLRMDATPALIRRAPSRLGQHTREVLQNDLQLSDTAIAALYADGGVAGE